MISFSWDSFIVLCFIGASVYGFILPKNKIAVICLAAYVASAIAQIWSQTVFQFITARGGALGSWTGNLSLFSVSVILFIGFIALLVTRGGLTADEQRSGVYGPFIMTAVGFFTAGLVISSLMTLMPEVLRANLLSTSKTAVLVWKYHIWWIVLPPLVIITTSFFRKL